MNYLKKIKNENRSEKNYNENLDSLEIIYSD